MAGLKLELMALCNYADISRDGKLSVNGIFDEIFAPNFPSQFLRGFLVFTIAGGKQNEEYILNVSIKSPKGEEVLSNNTSLKTGRTGKGNFIAELVGLPLPIAGEYKIQVSHNKSILSETSIYATATGGSTSATKKPNRPIN